MTNSKNNKDDVSIIYHVRNDSPKHIIVRRNKFLAFIILMPLLTIIGVFLGIVGLIHTSPFHLIQNYMKNNEAREAINRVSNLQLNLQNSLSENQSLKAEVDKLKLDMQNCSPKNPESASNSPTTTNDKPIVCPPVNAAPMANSIGLSTLSLFKPIQNQKDKTRPASLSLNDFKVVNMRDTVNLQFNIINLLGNDVKLAGHIMVLMKSDTMIEVYPINALNSPRDFQINYTAGEPFATQRFRPVDASFPKPRKAGNHVFTVFIFAKNGDLLHFQSVLIPVKI